MDIDKLTKEIFKYLYKNGMNPKSQVRPGEKHYKKRKSNRQITKKKLLKIKVFQGRKKKIAGSKAENGPWRENRHIKAMKKGYCRKTKINH